MVIFHDSIKFDTYLNELLSTRQIDKKHFSNIIGINRSQLYRFLSGEQTPDLELVQKIASKLNLRASEHEKLLESYECSLYGSEVIEGRKVVLKIIKDLIEKKNRKLFNISYTPNKNSLSLSSKENNRADVIPIYNRDNILTSLFSLLDSIKEKQGKIHIKIIMQPNFMGFMDILSSILDYSSKHSKDVCIEHVIRFKDITLDRNRLYNLDILQKLLPLSTYENIYKVYYSMGNYQTEVYETFFPNVICINNENGFTISSDFENGLYFNARHVVAMMTNEFDKIMKDSLPLFINLHNLFELSKYMYEFEKTTYTDTYLLHPENGFYTFPIEIIRKISKKFKLQNEIESIIINRLMTFRKRLETNKAIEIISLEKLNNFVDSGIFFIQDFITFDKNERIQIFKNLLEFVENEDNYYLYIMKENSPFFMINSAIYIIGDELLYIVPSYTNYDTADNIIIREKGIIEGFKDFFTSYFNEKSAITNQNAVALILKERINQLTNSL